MEMVSLLLIFISGALGQMIHYPLTSICAERGSTAILPCSFTPLKSVLKEGREIPLKIIRFYWFKNSLICQGSTSTVFDSKSKNNNSRYQYLGDLSGNCTLQIRDVEMTDDATFYFRMEADEVEGTFVNTTGVILTVIDPTKMRIISYSSDGGFSSGQTVILRCILSCSTTYPFEVTWLKDGHALSERRPTLLLNPLTAEHSGNYTCVFRSDAEKRSEPFVLQVKAAGFRRSTIYMVLFIVLALINTILASIFIRRKFCSSNRSAASTERHLEEQVRNHRSENLPRSSEADESKTNHESIMIKEELFQD